MNLVDIIPQLSIRMVNANKSLFTIDGAHIAHSLRFVYMSIRTPSYTMWRYHQSVFRYEGCWISIRYLLFKHISAFVHVSSRTFKTHSLLSRIVATYFDLCTPSIPESHNACCNCEMSIPHRKIPISTRLIYKKVQIPNRNSVTLVQLAVW